MMTISELHQCLAFLSLLFFGCVSSQSFAPEDIPIDGLVACPPRQVQALTKFKNEFDSSSCNQTEYFSGAWCDNTTGAITKLQLPSGCFTGTLKPDSSLFGFHQLRYLNLSYNSFVSSSLPLEFGNLNKLEVLILSSNGLLGQLPSSFSNLSMLSYLDLSYNKFTGSFPVVRNLSKLSYLDLSENLFFGTLNPNNSLFESKSQLRYLDLGYNNFVSFVPSEFGKLNKLEYLSLSFNGFSGQFPPTVNNLTSLTILGLRSNQFSGSFPLVQNLTKLSVLRLARNRFTGSIPSYLLSQPFLSFLELHENSLSSSMKAPNSSTTSRLESLLLGRNNFDGRILEPISKLVNLRLLDLSYANLSYPIDISIFSSLKSLLQLDISGNKISPASLRSDSKSSLDLVSLYMAKCSIGEFPYILKSFRNLEYLSISSNGISGTIPEWIWSLPRLTMVIINDNSFSGFQGSNETLVNSSVQLISMDSNSFRGALPRLPFSIKFFSANANSFTGNIPLSICNLSSLLFLNLGNNSFTGLIPQCLSNLMFVDLRNNNLEGSIPDTFHASASLQTLNLASNRITGKLPRSLQYCSSLVNLVVDNNEINDTFPFWLKDLPNLQVLTLSSNKFYGPISHQGFHELHIFEIADNGFTGILPPRYFENWNASPLAVKRAGVLPFKIFIAPPNDIYGTIYPVIVVHRLKGQYLWRGTSYTTLDLSENRFQGQIPESIGLLKALVALNLSNNAFTGHIPPSLDNLMELQSLDLSRNQLSGTIPQGLGSLSSLSHINVSHNQLKGEIPQGTQITGQSKSSFEDNAGLCGLPLQEKCFENNAPPTQQHKEEDEEEEEEQVVNWKGVVIGYGPGVLFGLAIAHFVASYKPMWLAKTIGI